MMVETTSTNEMEALAREAFSAYNDRDRSVERAREFSTPDAEVHAVTIGEVMPLRDEGLAAKRKPES